MNTHSHEREDWSIFERERELVRLCYTGPGDGFLFTDYQPVFVSISEEEWQRRLELEDHRDLPWVMVGTASGVHRPIASFILTWVKSENRVSLKYTGFYTTSPTGWWQRVKRLLGCAHRPVPQDRAPQSWEPLHKRQAVQMICSGSEEDLMDALDEIRLRASARQAEWASGLFVTYCSHQSPGVRRTAVAGIGELARRHGFADENALSNLISMAYRDSDARVRAAAFRTKSEVDRFARVSLERRNDSR